MFSACAESVKKLFNENLYSEIDSHWINLNSSQDFEDKSNFFPWFGDISYTWKQTEQKTSPTVFQHFPKNIQTNIDSLGRELHHLLPQEPLTKAFLPILLTSYFNADRSESLAFYSLFEHREYDSSLLSKGTKLIHSPRLEESYPKLTKESCNMSNIGRILPIYLKSIQFLVFLDSTSHICNPCLSFYAFQCMTDYLHLLGAKADYLLEFMDQLSLEDLLHPDPQLEKAILNYTHDIIHDFYTLRIRRRKKDGSLTSPNFPLSFLTFIMMLQDKLDQESIDSNVAAPIMSESILGIDDPLAAARCIDETTYNNLVDFPVQPAFELFN